MKYSVCTVWGFTSLLFEVRGQRSEHVLPRGTSAGRRGVCSCRQGSWWFWNWIYVLNFICEQLQPVLSLPRVPPDPGFISPPVPSFILSEQVSQSLSASSSSFFFQIAEIILEWSSSFWARWGCRWCRWCRWWCGGRLRYQEAGEGGREVNPLEICPRLWPKAGQGVHFPPWVPENWRD